MNIIREQSLSDNAYRCQFDHFDRFIKNLHIDEFYLKTGILLNLNEMSKNPHHMKLHSNISNIELWICLFMNFYYE